MYGLVHRKAKDNDIMASRCDGTSLSPEDVHYEDVLVAKDESQDLHFDGCYNTTSVKDKSNERG